MRIRWKSKRVLGGDPSRLRSGLPEKGYTFVEVLVAAALMGVVGTALYGAFAAGFCVLQATRENLRATQIMVQKMEAVRLFTWSQINDTNNYLKPLFVETYDPQNASKNHRGPSYTGYIRASVPTTADVNASYRTNMRTVTVSVYWTNYSGTKTIVQKREMETRVSRNGMQNYIWGTL